jgi:hypothetical protein
MVTILKCAENMSHNYFLLHGSTQWNFWTWNYICDSKLSAVPLGFSAAIPTIIAFSLRHQSMQCCHTTPIDPSWMWPILPRQFTCSPCIFERMEQLLYSYRSIQAISRQNHLQWEKWLGHRWRSQAATPCPFPRILMLYLMSANLW